MNLRWTIRQNCGEITGMGDIFDGTNPGKNPTAAWTVDGKPIAVQSGWSVDGKPVHVPRGDVFDRINPDPSSSHPTPSGVSGFLQGAWDKLSPIPLLRRVGESVATTGDPMRLPAEDIILSHLDTAGKAADAFKHGHYSEAAGYGLATALPVIGPAAASVGEDFGHGNLAYGAGGATALLAPFGITKAAGVAAPKIAPVIEGSAEATYAKALRPTGLKAKTLARDVVAPEALRRGIVATSLDDLAAKATAGRTQVGADISTLEHPILNPPANPTGPIPIHPIQKFVNFLEDMRQGNGKTQGPTRINGRVVNPVKDAAISRYQGVLREMAANDPIGSLFGALSERGLLEFRRALDEQVQTKHAQIPGTDTPAPLSVTRPLSNLLREEFNSTHPDIARAFSDYRFFKTFETLANRAQAAKTGAVGLFNALDTPLKIGAADLIFHQNALEAFAMSTAFKVMHDAIRSTAWRTMSGVAKHRIAQAMANGQFHSVLAILNGAGIGTGAAGADIGSQQ